MQTTFKCELSEGDSVAIGDGVILRLERKSGRRARIAIEAPTSVQIHRLNRAPMPGDLDLARD